MKFIKSHRATCSSVIFFSPTVYPITKHIMKSNNVLTLQDFPDLGYTLVPRTPIISYQMEYQDQLCESADVPHESTI